MFADIVSNVSPCYAYQYQDWRRGESDAEYVERLAKELDDEFQRVGPRNVIAFVAETVGGADCWVYHGRAWVFCSSEEGVR